MTSGGPTTTETHPEARRRPPSKIDPRIRQRLIEVRRSEGRRRLRVLLTLGGLVLFGVTSWGLTRSPLLDVDHLRVDGAIQTPAAQVLAVAGLRPGMAMTDVAAGAAARRIRALPWVRAVHVERRWPSTVTVHVLERVPVAAAPATGGVALVDRQGRVLAVTAAPPPDRPMLTGLPPAGAPGSMLAGRVAELLAVAQALPPAVVPRVAGVAAAAGGEVELRLRPQGVVKLGAPEQLPEKMVAIQTVLAQVDLSRLAVLDVRVPASPAITRA